MTKTRNHNQSTKQFLYNYRPMFQKPYCMRLNCHTLTNRSNHKELSFLLAFPYQNEAKKREIKTNEQKEHPKKKKKKKKTVLPFEEAQSQLSGNRKKFINP